MRRLYNKGYKWCKQEGKKFMVSSEIIFCPSCNRRLRNNAHQGANADAKRAEKYERAY